MRIATWNINSVRLRIKHVLRFVREYDIDVMCLQETKTTDNFFPLSEFLNLGMKYYYFRGEKSYNGVAILSKVPIIKKSRLNWCGKEDTRHISVVLNNNITLHNFYIPAGGDIPDTSINEKFDHKIKFLDEMTSYFEKDHTKNKILVGDLNIAPYENDVWSHKQLLKIVSHTPLETENMKKLIKVGRWVDTIRYFNSFEKKIFTWWSYRNKDWKKSNRGRRLDHIWSSNDLLPLVKKVSIQKKNKSLGKTT